MKVEIEGRTYELEVKPNSSFTLQFYHGGRLQVQQCIANSNYIKVR